MNFVFDIDGTLSYNGISINADITEALKQLESRNETIIFASARPIRDMTHIIPDEIKSRIWIGGNGSFIKVDDTIRCRAIRDKTAHKILDHILANNYDYMIDSDWDYSYKGDSNSKLYQNINKETARNLPLNQLEKICKIVIFHPSDKTVSWLKSMNVSTTEHTDEKIIDISALGCNKAASLRELHIEPFVAFGNDANDVAMFTDSIRSYCVGESEYGRYATDIISRDSVARMILAQLDFAD